MITPEPSAIQIEIRRILSCLTPNSVLAEADQIENIINRERHRQTVRAIANVRIWLERIAQKMGDDGEVEKSMVVQKLAHNIHQLLGPLQGAPIDVPSQGVQVSNPHNVQIDNVSAQPPETNSVVQFSAPQ